MSAQTRTNIRQLDCSRMRVSDHFVKPSVLLLLLLFSSLFFAPSAAPRPSKPISIRTAGCQHRSTALADPSAGDQGSAEPGEPQERAQRTKRLMGNKPTSLDLTFHMLRELMETSRAERMSHRARLNQHLLKAVGRRSGQLK